MSSLNSNAKNATQRDERSSKYAWIDWSKALPFTSAVDSVLNSLTLLVVMPSPLAINTETFISNVQSALLNPEFGQAFRQAVFEQDSGELWEEDARYQPPTDSQAINVNPMSLAVVRDRLEAMLTCHDRFLSPYRKQLNQAEATMLVEGFIQSFSPSPSHWAEVNPELLASLDYLDNFNDGILAIAVGQHLVFLLNNGSD